jgi:hypothetical protein
MNRPALLSLVMLAGAGSPLVCLAATGAEVALGPDFGAMPDSGFVPDSIVAAQVMSTPDSVSAAKSDAARDSVSAPDSVFVPDPAKMALVEFALRDFDEVRVFTDSTRFFGRRVVASSEGVRLRRINWGRSISDYAEERMVPWSEVESIKVRRGASGAGLLVGAGIGLAIGMTIALAQGVASTYTFGVDGEAQKGANRAIAWGFLGGAVLGWLVDHPGPWRTVYP